MVEGRIEQALARLEAAMARTEAAAGAVAEAASRPDELAGLQERHSRLRTSVAHSLRELDDLLAETPR